MPLFPFRFHGDRKEIKPHRDTIGRNQQRQQGEVMTVLKIVSDPYNKQVTFYVREETKNQWSEITEQNHPNGRLLQDKIVHGFFPFQVQQTSFTTSTTLATVPSTSNFMARMMSTRTF